MFFYQLINLIKRLFIFYGIQYEIILRPYRALVVGGSFTRPVGAGYNLNALSGLRLQ
jgi:hypothetical protein